MQSRALRLNIKSICFYSAVFLLSGCANMTTVERRTPFDFSYSDGKPNSGKAIHLDAKQRLVIQKDYGIICAEPAPDALSAVAANSSIGLTTASENQIAIANALSESAGSIGLRTQSIQLMRDALYRVCELHFGRALNDDEVMRLHQKYQDTMLAVLAVEQITGAVSAAPVTVTSNSEGQATARSRTLIEDLAKERVKQTEIETELKALKEDRDNKKATADEALKAHEAESDENAKKELKAKLDDANLALKTANDLLSAKEKQLEDTKTFIALLEDSKESALSSAQAATGGDSKLGNITQRSYDPQTSQYVAKAVTDIVSAALNKDYILENCITFVGKQFEKYLDRTEEAIDTAERISNNLNYAENEALSFKQQLVNKAQTNDGAITEMTTTCIDLIKATVEKKLASNTNTPSTGTSVTPSQTSPQSDTKPNDSDGDGVTNEKDKCSNTPRESNVDEHGCLSLPLEPLVLEFPSNGHKLADNHLKALLPLIDKMRKSDDLVLEIIGHADNQGTPEDKLAISLKRAESVKNILVAQDIPIANLEIVAKGDSDPVSTLDTLQGRAKNRRVTFNFKKKS